MNSRFFYITQFYKENQQAIKIGLVGFLISSFSFLTGYIAGANILTRPPMIIDTSNEYVIDALNTSTSGTANSSSSYVSQSLKTADSKFFASINGKNFYPINCDGVSRIKQENKTYFNTAQQAIDTGYKASTKCY